MKCKILIGLLAAIIATTACRSQQVNSLVTGSKTAIIPNKRLQLKEIDLSTGVRLRYVQQGNNKGVPVIFLHGITDSWHSFESVMAHLPSSVRAFALSQRGHGDSERPQTGYTPKDFAADVAAFVRQKKLGKVIIAGHSMGGVNALQFAIDFPELTRGLVIIDSDAALKKNPGMDEFVAEVMGMQGAISRTFMDAFQKATLSKPIDSAYYKLLVDEGTKVPVRVFQAALQGLVMTDNTALLEQIRVPVLIFWGRADSFCHFKGQELMLTNIPDAKLLIYKTGHALHWEEPQKFANDLFSFLTHIQ